MPTTAHRLWALVLIMAMCLGGSFAQAAPAKGDKAEALRLYREARTLHARGETRAALLRLEAAYAAFPTDEILVSIANRHLDLGEPEEASEVLGRVKATGDRLAKRVASLRAEVDGLLAKAVIVQLTANVKGATALVDGAQSYTLPTTLGLTRGVHRFEVGAPGYEPVVLTREVRGVQTIQVEAWLTPSMGRWQVHRVDGGDLQEVRLVLDDVQVLLSEEERVAHTSRPRDMVAGEHVLVCLYGVDVRVEVPFRVRTGALTTVTCDMGQGLSLDPALAPWAWATLGLSVVALGVGVGFLAEWAHTRDSYAELVLDDGNPNTEDPPLYIVSNRNAAVGGTLLGVAALSAAASAVLFTW